MDRVWIQALLSKAIDARRLWDKVSRLGETRLATENGYPVLYFSGERAEGYKFIDEVFNAGFCDVRIANNS